jgi:hypothetical protein
MDVTYSDSNMRIELGSYLGDKTWTDVSISLIVIPDE